jgi:hypothetical protein
VLLFVPVWQSATRPGRHRAAAAAVGLLGLLVVAVLALGSLQPSPQGPVVTWYDALPYAGLAAVPPEVAAIVAGSILFLIESANVVVRLALAPLAAKEATAERRADDGAVLFRSPDDVLELPLPGGRLIGPLERILILALALAGQFTAIGAVVAAKGIIRFPEISKDSAGGSNRRQSRQLGARRWGCGARRPGLSLKLKPGAARRVRLLRAPPRHGRVRPRSAP